MSHAPYARTLLSTVAGTLLVPSYFPPGHERSAAKPAPRDPYADITLESIGASIESDATLTVRVWSGQ